MSDRLSPERRSWNMGRIRGKNTKPETIVRSLLHRMGYRFLVNRRDLPGKPDIVLPKHATVVFVHGCFWHRHPGCEYAYVPKTRTAFWRAKFEANKKRDADASKRLSSLGWQVVVLWECEIEADPVHAVEKVVRVLIPAKMTYPLPERRKILKVAEARLQRMLDGENPS